MIAKEFCLKGKEAFEKVLRDGLMYQSESFGIMKLKREDKDHSKFGFIISTKVSKIAFQRNRIKRAMSEAVRYAQGDIINGYDVIFLAKGKCVKTSVDEIMREVREALIKSGLCK